MPLVLLLAVLWPIAELLVAIQVAHLIGVVPTIVLVIAGWPLGTWALRRQGAAAWRRLGQALAERRTPAREVVDGALVLVGAVLLMVPGFITDVLGLLLLLPPSRALARPLLMRNLQSRIVLRATQSGRRPSAYDVDSTASDIEQPQLRP
jgi:UPF0716 protein FxsA